MLKSMHIKNYAIIDDLQIDFADRFVVFTGETGAGKSIIVGALTCLCGERADTAFVGKKGDKAIIEGVFDINERMLNILEENDFAIDLSDDLIIRRTIAKDGKNTIRINDTAVTLNFLSRLLKEEIDIHSQKENAFLLNAKKHLGLLDRYSDDTKMLKDYQTLYHDWYQEKKNFDAYLKTDYNLSDLEYFKFVLEELNAAKLDIDEEEELQKSEKRYKSAQKHLDILERIKYLADGDEGIKTKLYDLRKLLGEIDELHEVFNTINDIYYTLDDQLSSIDDFYKQYDISPEEINQIEERLYTINRLKRKYGKNVAELLQYQDELSTKIKQFENREEYIELSQKRINELYDKAYNAANKLSKIRKAAAKNLETKIIAELHDLMLPNVSFQVDFKEKELSEDGIDNIEFLISLNRGEDLKPLVKVASGGEISRVMLGLKTIFSALNQTSLLVFDEIDSGVSGKVAFTIGQKMATIAKQAQVLAITHLAPVAAFADQHLFIYKTDDKDQTTTHIRELSYEERIKELAIMASSVSDKAALDAAQKLIEKAKASYEK